MSLHQTMLQIFKLCLVVCLTQSSAAIAEVFIFNTGEVNPEVEKIEVIPGDNYPKVNISPIEGKKGLYSFDFAKSGHYTLRFLRAGNELWRDTLLVLLEAPPAGTSIEVSWAKVSSESKYRVFYSKPGGKQWRAETSKTGIYLQGTGTPWIVQVHVVDSKKSPFEKVEQLKMKFRVRSASKRSSLPKILPLSKVAPISINPQTAKPAATVKLNPFEPDDDQNVYEPEYKDLLVNINNSWLENVGDSMSNSPLPPLIRSHRISGWLRSFKESFEVDRRDRFASMPTQGQGSGFGLIYYITPTLQVISDLNTHGTSVLYEAGGTEPPAEQQKRIRFLLGAGVDVLNLESRRPNLSLDIGPNIAFLQLPLTGDDQKVGDFGLQIGIQYFAWNLRAYARFFKSNSHEENLSWASPWSLWKIRPFLTLYQQETKAKDGSSKSHFMESGFRFGIERDF